MPDLPLPVLLVVFAVAGVVTSVAGVSLARSGDAIADDTGLGGMSVGMLLLAGATSLPEVVTDVSAAVTDAPDIAVGDLFGSSLANMAILALLDLVNGGRLWRVASANQLVLGSLATALTAVAVTSIVLPAHPRLGWIGPETVLIVLAYLVVIRLIERRDVAEEAASEGRAPGRLVVPDRSPHLRRHATRFGLAALLILLSAPVLALTGTQIADETGVGRTFVGAVFVAMSTSLPELVASFAAVRLGAFDLAVGNLLGSNAFNMTILLPVDLAYAPGPVLADVARQQALVGVGAVGLMALVLVGLWRGRHAGGGRLPAIGVLIAYVALIAALGAGIG